MATAHDVAAYILKKKGSLDTYKLQKLAYYSQAWHLTWDAKPLFKARIEAWANGPVVPALYEKHRGRFKVDEWPWGNADNLTDSEVETVDAVLRHYGNRTGFSLRELTHKEKPWRDARGSLPPGAASNEIITPESMYDYYGSL